MFLTCNELRAESETLAIMRNDLRTTCSSLKRPRSTICEKNAVLEQCC